MRTLLFFLSVFSFCTMKGQKLVKKAFITPETQFIQIDSQNCYKVSIGTSKKEEVTIAGSMEGEYSKDLLVTIEQKGATVLISTGFQPNFTNPNDKLSAHKVISIELNISLPEYKEVSVYGTNCNVLAEGDYKKLKVKLADGTCSLENVGETVEVNTQKGNIFLSTSNGDIVAKSTYGEVRRETIPKGDNVFVLNTVEGNIYLKKTK
ncbi:hypothetical protein KIM67_08955 [Flagellimonas sp. 389]|nr:hypothetical protein [Flagellimonas sp. 389]